MVGKWRLVGVRENAKAPKKLEPNPHLSCVLSAISGNTAVSIDVEPYFQSKNGLPMFLSSCLIGRIPCVSLQMLVLV